VIDQRHLPHRFLTGELRTPNAETEAIRDVSVRGAPLTGAVAGYSLYLAARLAPDGRVAAAVVESAETLAPTRPTAVTLRRALRSVTDHSRDRTPDAGVKNVTVLVGCHDRIDG
jgi:methylthioribose-1-phosphate isomerase